MDRTLVGSVKVEVRGGTLTVVDSTGDVPALHVGSEPRVIGRRPGCHMVLAKGAERVAVSKSERFGPLVGSTPAMRGRPCGFI